MLEKLFADGHAIRLSSLVFFWLRSLHFPLRFSFGPLLVCFVFSSFSLLPSIPPFDDGGNPVASQPCKKLLAFSNLAAGIDAHDRALSSNLHVSLYLVPRTSYLVLS